MTSPPNLTLPRRRLLQISASFGGAGLLGLGGCATAGGAVSGPPRFESGPGLAPIRAAKDRLFDITVCLRPFRAAGPRLGTETIGEALILHRSNAAATLAALFARSRAAASRQA